MPGNGLGPPKEVGPRPGHHSRTEGTDTTSTPAPIKTSSYVHSNVPASQQVNWPPTHEFIEAVLAQANAGHTAQLIAPSSSGSASATFCRRRMRAIPHSSSRGVGTW